MEILFVVSNKEGNFPNEKFLYLEIKLNQLFKIYTIFYY